MPEVCVWGFFSFFAFWRYLFLSPVSIRIPSGGHKCFKQTARLVCPYPWQGVYIAEELRAHPLWAIHGLLLKFGTSERLSVNEQRSRNAFPYCLRDSFIFIKARTWRCRGLLRGYKWDISYGVLIVDTWVHSVSMETTCRLAAETNGQRAVLKA